MSKEVRALSQIDKARKENVAQLADEVVVLAVTHQREKKKRKKKEKKSSLPVSTENFQM